MLPRLDRGVAWVQSHFPRTYRLVLPLARALLRLTTAASPRSYWTSRKHMKYYGEVVRLAAKYAPQGGAVIDVGAYETNVVGALTWFERRVALDLYPVSRKRNVETIQADFMDYRPNTYFDLVLCLQVLEHLEAPQPFARTLFEIGQTVIISVPYLWPAGIWPGHLQDAVDEAKLERWTGRKPTEVRIVADEADRVIAVYAGGGTLVGAHEERGT